MAPGRLPAGERVRGSLALPGGRIPDDIPHALGTVGVRKPPGDDPVEINPPGGGEERPAMLLQREDLEQRTGVAGEELGQRRAASSQRRRPQVGVEPGKVERAERRKPLTRRGSAHRRAVPVQCDEQAVEDGLPDPRGHLGEPGLQLVEAENRLLAEGGDMAPRVVQMQEGAAAVVERLEQPVGAVERS